MNDRTDKVSFYPAYKAYTLQRIKHKNHATLSKQHLKGGLGVSVSTLDKLGCMMHLIDADSGQNKIIPRPRQIIRQSSYYIAFSFVPFCL